MQHSKKNLHIFVFFLSCLLTLFFNLNTSLISEIFLQVLMGFLVGNDFIPHLPDLHINKGALPILYKTYIDVLPTLGGKRLFFIVYSILKGWLSPLVCFHLFFILGPIWRPRISRKADDLSSGEWEFTVLY